MLTQNDGWFQCCTLVPSTATDAFSNTVSECPALASPKRTFRPEAVRHINQPIAIDNENDTFSTQLVLENNRVCEI
jgi:hypothetical protein